MEKAAAYTLESVKKSAYGIDESGRVHIGNALRTGQSPWATISEVQQRFNLSVNGCNCAIQFLHSMDSTNSSINVALVDALITQLDAMVERLDQNSRLELLKQTIRLIEVKELQCVSIAIMKRLDTIPEKYLKRLIAKGLISVRRYTFCILLCIANFHTIKFFISGVPDCSTEARLETGQPLLRQIDRGGAVGEQSQRQV